MTEKKKRVERPLGRPEPLNDADLMMTHRQCPATSKRTGERCKRYCAPGQRTCLWHGSGTRRAKTAAAKRVAQASGYAADMLAEFMADPDVDVKLRTQIAQDLLDRSGVNAKKVMELTVDKGQSFFDNVMDAYVVDVGELESVVDAEVEDETDEERWAREDAAKESIAARKRLTAGSTPPAPRNPERDRAEAKAIREHRDEPEDDGLSAPDKFGTRQDTRKRKVSPSTSTADPHAERYESRGSRRSMSPKRYEAKQNDRD